MANGTLSSYFQQDKERRIKGSAVSPYSTPADTGAGAGTGSAPAAPTAAPSAPTGSTRGGSGFVNFGSYFGANAPSIQRESQKAAAGASNDQLTAMRGQGGNVGAGTQPSTFNQMLMGGTQRRAAEQETARRLPFQQLRERMTTSLTDPMQAQGIARAQKDAAYKQWTENLPTQYRYNNTPEELRAMFEDEYAAGTWQQKTPGMVSTPGSSL